MSLIVRRTLTGTRWEHRLQAAVVRGRAEPGAAADGGGMSAFPGSYLTVAPAASELCRSAEGGDTRC